MVKNLIKNFSTANSKFTVRETSKKALGVNMGTIYFGKNISDENTSTSIDQALREMLGGDSGASNLRTLKNALVKSRSQITKNSTGSNRKLDIRGYIQTEDNKDKTLNRIKAVKKWLKEPVGLLKVSGTGSSKTEKFDELGDSIVKNAFEEKEFVAISSNDPISLTSDDAKNVSRVPKEEAYNVSKTGDLDDVIEIILVFDE